MENEQNYDYSEDSILDLVEDLRNNPTKYIKSLDINGFSEILEEIITNLLPCSPQIKIDVLNDFSIKLNFDNLIGFTDNNWHIGQFAPTEKDYHNFWLLNQLSQSFKIKEYSKYKLETIREFEKGKRIEYPSNDSKFDCTSMEILFTLDKVIWGETLDWNKDSIVKKIKAFSSQYENVKFNTLN